VYLKQAKSVPIFNLASYSWTTAVTICSASQTFAMPNARGDRGISSVDYVGYSFGVHEQIQIICISVPVSVLENEQMILTFTYYSNVHFRVISDQVSVFSGPSEARNRSLR
jgi:hypothetical protein